MRFSGWSPKPFGISKARGLSESSSLGVAHCGISLPVDLFRSMAKARSGQIPGRLGKVADANWQLDAAMAAQATAANVQYVSVLGNFCDKSGCLTVGDRTLLQPDLLFRDLDHLTETGSRVLTEHSRAQIFGRN
jgi:hypothetical protein